MRALARMEGTSAGNRRGCWRLFGALQTPVLPAAAWCNHELETLHQYRCTVFGACPDSCSCAVAARASCFDQHRRRLYNPHFLLWVELNERRNCLLTRVARSYLHSRQSHRDVRYYGREKAIESLEKFDFAISHLLTRFLVPNHQKPRWNWPKWKLPCVHCRFELLDDIVRYFKCWPLKKSRLLLPEALPTPQNPYLRQSPLRCSSHERGERRLQAALAAERA